MIFGKLSSRESLRDLIFVIEAHQSKSYHLGVGKNVSNSNLSHFLKGKNYLYTYPINLTQSDNRLFL
ncbi:DUF4372 domain-containing protein [Flavobacterium ovatum]|uniref:DUF4372 domain-containing protein n=1 Tax=Flavobacterium ovatum TaxID=1928857 RepID=UPI00344EE85E